MNRLKNILAIFSLKVNGCNPVLHNVSEVIIVYQRIRNFREDRDLTQQNMADHLQCSQRIYSNYERGDVDIPTSVLIKLANFHDTSIDYLLNLTDDPKPYPRKPKK